MWITLAVALPVAALACVVLRPLLVRYALARPNARSSHVIPTPQGGGIPVLLGLVAGLLAAALVAPVPGVVLLLASLLALMALVGFIDDIRPIAAWPRLALQGLIAAAALALLPPDLHIFPVIPLPLERMMLLIGLIWFVNLTNFMDGLDWMVVAGLGPALAFLGGLALVGAQDPGAGLIALGLLGGLLGFAPFNKPVARLFLGDVGSLAIGLGLGFGLIHLAGRHGLVPALLPALYFMADATFTLLRRALAGEAVMSAHRSHVYQRATTMGWRVPQIVGQIFIVNVLLLLLAAAALWLSHPVAQVAMIVAGAALVAGLMRRLSSPPPGVTRA